MLGRGGRAWGKGAEMLKTDQVGFVLLKPWWRPFSSLIGLDQSVAITNKLNMSHQGVEFNVYMLNPSIRVQPS